MKTTVVGSKDGRSQIDSPLALLPPGTAPAAVWTAPSIWWVWVDSSGEAAGGGTPLGSAGSTIQLAGGTGGIQGTGETGGTGTAAAGTPRFAEPTSKRGKEERPPQTQAGTASWPACVLWGEEIEDIVSKTSGQKGGKRKARRGLRMRAQEKCKGHRRREGKGRRCGEATGQLLLPGRPFIHSFALWELELLKEKRNTRKRK